jgi:hypothetical protein
MEAPKTFYVTSVNQGFPLTLKKSGSPSGAVVTNTGDYNDTHEWSVEHCDEQQIATIRRSATVKPGDEPNVVALKSIANGKYLFCSGNQDRAAVTTGPRQWWLMSRDGVTAPGACRLDLIGSAGFSLGWIGSDMQESHPGSAVCLRRYKVSVYGICDYRPPLTCLL